MTTAPALPQRSRQLSKGLVRAGDTTVLVVLCVALLLYYSFVASFMVQRLNMNDFGKFYYATRSFLDGQDMYEVSRQNMNPPHFHLLMIPFAALNPAGALSLWTIVNLVALGVSLRAIARELRLDWTSRSLACTAVAVMGCSATVATAVTGQLTFVLLLPVTLAWIAARRNNWNRAAAYLGACASIKPFLGIFLIYLALRRDRTPAAIMVLSGAACTVLGLAIFGWSAYEGWLGVLASVDWTWSPMNGSLAALMSRAFAENPIYPPAVSALWLVKPATTALALLIGVISFSHLVQSPPRSVDHTFAVLLLTAQLVSPLGWIYYLWLIAGPAAAIFLSWKSHASRLRDGLLILALPGLIGPFSMIATARIGSGSAWAALTLGSLYVWTTFFLWGSLLVDWRARMAFSRSPGFECVQAGSRARVGTDLRPPAPDCSPALPAS